MTNPDATLLINVIDRSGSMSSIRTDAEGGFNTFVSDQKAQPGKATIFTAKFDDNYEIEHNHLDLAIVGSFALEPRGSTALLDAIGRTIENVGAYLANLPEDERPGKVIFTVVTDGQENASREYTKGRINDMITHQRDVYGWQFIFLAANQDAIATGADYGFTKDGSMSFAATGQGVGSTYTGLSSSISRFRSGATAGTSFTDGEREDAMGGSPQPSSTTSK